LNREPWPAFLKQWSKEWIAAHDPKTHRPLDETVVRTGWLGFDPAGPAEIGSVENRLGMRLPPSLRDFLLVTNGWRNAGNFVYRLGGTAEIGRLRDMDSHWIDAYGRFSEEEDALLRRSVQLSLEGDACVLFLDPEDVDDDGEWAAYFLSSWSGTGPRRFGSFYELMYHLYARFHALRASRPG
jgi:hypothetical protein